jgi:D-alanyl-D-alanine carboxypeptidase/D-alanyl-D-alanine-endopeptidase (penicillin-binding protein 4)
MMRGRGPASLLAWSFCAVLLTGCRHSRPTAVPAATAPKPTPALRQLQREIGSTLQAPTLGSGTWGVLIKSLRHDDVLFSWSPRKLLTPASNLKIVTLAAAAHTLGWDHTFETHVLGLGAIDFGFLDGDLIVRGTGDPSLSEDDGSAQQAFRTWADRLKTQGVNALSGRIIGDDNAFDDEPLGSGWMWDDLDQGYSAGIGPLQINHDAARLTVTPGATVGDAAVAVLSPDGSGLTLRNHVQTTAADAVPRIRTRRLPGTATLDVSGSLPVGAPAILRSVAVENPTLYFASELRAALLASGIDIRGPAVDIDALSDPPRVQDAVPLVTHRSPPLTVLAETLMKLSQNQYAETLVKTMGARAGDATFEGGRRVMTELVNSWGVAPSDLFVADGSGLSRYNLISTHALVTVLSHVHRDARLKDPFERSLPVAGEAGTLADRLKGTRAAGVVRAKTGSMTNVRSIAGYMTTAEGEPIVFAIIANNYGVPGTEIDRVIDTILARVASFTR